MTVLVWKNTPVIRRKRAGYVDGWDRYGRPWSSSALPLGYPHVLAGSLVLLKGDPWAICPCLPHIHLYRLFSEPPPKAQKLLRTLQWMCKKARSHVPHGPEGITLNSISVNVIRRVVHDDQELPERQVA